ncbi:hypothetical protein KKD81_02610 [Patescibacteria group bacterium]|nr:hypothetical protein [Patescibacteria group bacterium]
MANQATLLNIGTAPIMLHSLSEQLHALGSAVKSLSSEHSDKCAQLKDGSCPSGYAGFVAVPRFDQFGCFRVPASIEGWHRSSGWGLRSRVKGMQGIEGHGERFLEEEFSVADKTIEAFDHLQSEQGVLGDHRFERNPLRIFPVRTSEEVSPECGVQEFFPDLASLAWILAAHPEWRLSDNQVLLRCVGERFKNRPGEDLVIGYKDGVRVIDFYRASFDNVVTLIGKAPK